MPVSTFDRDALLNRALPEMVLSTGDASSMTAPPAPMPHYLNSNGRAIKRFEIEGNAISMCRASQGYQNALNHLNYSRFRVLPISRSPPQQQES